MSPPSLLPRRSNNDLSRAECKPPTPGGTELCRLQTFNCNVPVQNFSPCAGHRYLFRTFTQREHALGARRRYDAADAGITPQRCSFNTQSYRLVPCEPALVEYLAASNYQKDWRCDCDSPSEPLKLTEPDSSLTGINLWSVGVYGLTVKGGPGAL